MGMQSIGGGKYLIKNKNSKKCIHSRKMRKYNQHFNHYNCNKRNSAQQYYIVNAKAKSRKLKIKKNNRRSRVPKKGPNRTQSRSQRKRTQKRTQSRSQRKRTQKRTQ